MPDRVPDDVLYRILDVARFAPSGGNRQGWHVIVVRDPERRRALRDLYVPVEAEYVRSHLEGEVPFAPGWKPRPDPATPIPVHFSDHLDEVPVLLLVLAELGSLTVTDALLERPSLVGGASVYPFAHNILLAARNEGVGGVMTTLLAREEPAVAAVCGIPSTHALVAMVALGYPQKQVTRLSRKPVAAFTTVDTFAGETFPGTDTCPS